MLPKLKKAKALHRKYQSLETRLGIKRNRWIEEAIRAQEHICYIEIGYFTTGFYGGLEKKLSFSIKIKKSNPCPPSKNLVPQQPRRVWDMRWFRIVLLFLLCLLLLSVHLLSRIPSALSDTEPNTKHERVLVEEKNKINLNNDQGASLKTKKNEDDLRRISRATRALWNMQAVAGKNQQTEFSLLELKQKTKSDFKWLPGEDPKDFDEIYSDAIQELERLKTWGELVFASDSSTGLPIVRVVQKEKPLFSARTTSVGSTDSNGIALWRKALATLSFIGIAFSFMKRLDESWGGRLRAFGRGLTWIFSFFSGRPRPDPVLPNAAAQDDAPAELPATEAPVPEPPLPPPVVQNNAAEEDNERPTLECPICWASFLSGERICSIPCGHVFHVSCLDLWESERCPVCNSPNNLIRDRRVLYFV